MTLCDTDPVVDTEEHKAPTNELPDGIPPLRQLYLYLSNGCNLKCRHCWITPTFANGTPSIGDVIDIELLRTAVVEAKPLGLTVCKLTGGEPMLHPRFIEIAHMLSTEGLSLSMETNGTLLDSKTAQYLKDQTNLHFVSVSIDGAKPETHDHFRGVSGAFEGALKGVRSLIAAGYDNVQVIMSLHRSNLSEIESLVKLAVESGVASVKFNPVIATGRGIAMHKRGEALDFNEMCKLVRYIRGELQSKTSIRLLIMAPPSFSTISELLQGEDGGSTCGVKHVLGILGTGELALCGIGRTVPELVYGHLGKDSIRDVWLNHPTLAQMRRDLDDYENYPGICGQCIHAETCLTHCVAQNYTDSGHLVWTSPLCAEMERRGIFPTSRLRVPVN
jgi:SynChlorMet cassette radical SAM/SPASM protein ScmF